jgi:uracil-DNA glycosylase family 4
LLASIRDYVEQLREEGFDGVPCATANAGSGARVRAEHQAMTGTGTPTARLPKSPEIPLAAESAASYAGLENVVSLEELRAFIGDCKRCKLCLSRTNLVFGTGNPNAELMFVGEGPGADEDASGEPFVGRAGQLLTDIIERGMGMWRAEVYICNVVKCRPPGNRNPEPDEVAACEPFLMRQIDLVKPRVIVALGAFAVQSLLRVKTPISKLRGLWHEVRGARLMPTFHPAYLLRNPADKRLVWIDIQEVMRVLGRPLPRRPGGA